MWTWPSFWPSYVRHAPPFRRESTGDPSHVGLGTVGVATVGAEGELAYREMKICVGPFVFFWLATGSRFFLVKGG